MGKFRSITVTDDNHRDPVNINQVPSELLRSLMALHQTARITPHEFIVTYSYLFSGLSLNQLRDRCVKHLEDKYSFPSKQTIHQNIIVKVTSMMNAEMDHVEALERKRNTRMIYGDNE